MISYIRLLACGALLLLMSPAYAAVAADPSKGEIIAKRWCATCHLVAADQKTANSDVPSFASLAKSKLSSEALRDFLSNPHPRMPDMSLTRSEIADIVAYIRSLDH
jgi:mono/diheme cytochrome c family protein